MRQTIVMPVAILMLSAIAAGAQGFIADSARGKQLFTTLSCVQCHSVNDEGGNLGPDLGKIVDRGFTPATLAATMWNHAPAMWTTMRQKGIQAADMPDQAA